MFTYFIAPFYSIPSYLSYSVILSQINSDLARGYVLKLWTEVATVVGFLQTINRELCYPTKAGVNSPATQEKIQRYVTRSL